MPEHDTGYARKPCPSTFHYTIEKTFAKLPPLLAPFKHFSEKINPQPSFQQYRNVSPQTRLDIDNAYANYDKKKGFKIQRQAVLFFRKM